MRGRLLTASPQWKPSNKKLIHGHQIHIIHSGCSYVVATDVLGVHTIQASQCGKKPRNDLVEIHLILALFGAAAKPAVLLSCHTAISDWYGQNILQAVCARALRLYALGHY